MHTQMGYQLGFRVMDYDERSDDDLIGAALLPVAESFEEEGDNIQSVLELGKRVRFDKEIGKGFEDSRSHEVHDGDDHSNESHGTLVVRVKMIPKQKLEVEFFDTMLNYFDLNKDDKLDRQEVDMLLSALGVSMTTEEFNRFWGGADKDQDDEVNREEAVELFRSLVFVNSDIANRTVHLLQFGPEGLDRTLMEPVPRSQKSDEIEIMDRESGVIVKETIPNYIKVAIKAMYNGKAMRVLTTGPKAIKVLHKLSVSRGQKYDEPSSKKDIEPFIALHNLNVDEAEKPWEEYNTFNEFFYRALKPDARPIFKPNDDKFAVCPADCRMMVFPDIAEATEFWIKGDEFTVARVFGAAAPGLAERYESGSLCIARLAPQDYHRWHLPVSCMHGPRTPIDGALFTVNPIAINSTANVYTENKRAICELDSEEFGKVVLVAVGATMVGSINWLTEVNHEYTKGTQHGYFSFGGSTVLLFFERGSIEFAPEIVSNSRKNLETLVRVNSLLGTAKREQ